MEYIKEKVEALNKELSKLHLKNVIKTHKVFKEYKKVNDDDTSIESYELYC